MATRRTSQTRPNEGWRPEAQAPQRNPSTPARTTNQRDVAWVADDAIPGGN